MTGISKTKKTIYFMILIGLFSCLCFIGTTYLYIPMGSKIHLGNFFCIIAGLLCGGLVGGLSGAIGMGLSDLICSYGPDTIIRTIIVKFALGFIVGILFRYLLKRKKNLKWPSLIIGLIFMALFITFLTLYLVYDGVILIGERKFTINIGLVISLPVMSVCFLTIFFLIRKMKLIISCVVVTTSIGMFINVILEFFLKIPFKMLLASMNFEQAVIYAFTSLPSALFTAVMTTIFIGFVYLPLYYATSKVNRFNDLYDTINEITTLENDKIGRDEPKN